MAAGGGLLTDAKCLMLSEVLTSWAIVAAPNKREAEASWAGPWGVCSALPRQPRSLWQDTLAHHLALPTLGQPLCPPKLCCGRSQPSLGGQRGWVSPALGVMSPALSAPMRG